MKKVILIQIPPEGQIFAVDDWNEAKKVLPNIFDVDYTILGTVNTTISAVEMNAGINARYNELRKIVDEVVEILEKHVELLSYYKEKAASDGNR